MTDSATSASAASPDSRPSSRAALRLPDSYVAGPPEDASACMQRVRGLSIERLVEMAEDPLQEFHTRWTCGQVLALSGDPRVRWDNPRMITIGGGLARIGIAASAIEREFEQYAQLGVRKEWVRKETPQFETRIAGFKMRKYLVTNGEYLEFLKATSYPELPSSWPFGAFPLERSNHPVYTVSVAAADAYAVWLSTVLERPFRLPSEIEWEYVARGPYDWAYPWGNVFDPDRANTREMGLLSSTAVGIFPDGCAHSGVADMAGNVEEYTADTYRPYPGGEIVEDDLYQRNRDYRIARGGSFTRYRDLARVTRRHGRGPTHFYVMGFRLVEDA